jgi:hypothetical protein
VEEPTNMILKIETSGKTNAAALSQKKKNSLCAAMDERQVKGIWWRDQKTKTSKNQTGNLEQQIDPRPHSNS